MPKFAYKGLTQAGKGTQGTVEAVDRRGVLRKLRAMGVRPVEVRPASGKTTVAVDRKLTDAGADTQVPAPAKGMRLALFKKSGAKLALPFYRKLLQLHANGMPVGDALNLMSQRMNEPELKALCEAVYRDLSEGRTLAMAQRNHPDVFDPTHAYLIEAGEATGNLTPIIENLIANMETSAQLQKKVRGAMAYPLVLCLFAMAVVAIFLFYLLPNIRMMLERVGGELNLPARIMIGVSDFLLTDGPFVLAGLIVLAIGWIQWRKTPKGLLATDQWLLQFPLVRQLVFNNEICRLTNVIGVLLANGVNTTEALRLSGAVLQNVRLQQRFQAARNLINDGAPFSVAMQRHAMLPQMDVDILGIGESTGNLVSSFREIYASHAEELSDQLKFTTNLIAGLALGFAFTLVIVITFGIALSIMDMSQNILQR